MESWSIATESLEMDPLELNVKKNRKTTSRLNLIFYDKLITKRNNGKGTENIIFNKIKGLIKMLIFFL